MWTYKSDLASEIPFEKTTCGRDAYQRGSGQKIIGFSLFRNNDANFEKERGYFEGIEPNLKSMASYYPGWIMRVYFDLDSDDPIHDKLCQLACQDTNLDICDVRNLPGTPMKNALKVFGKIWRWFPTLDPQVLKN